MALQLDDLLLPCNWDDLGLDHRQLIWNAYRSKLEDRGYHLMGSEMYKTLGKDDDYTPPPPSDPFHPTNEEDFVHHLYPRNLYSSRNFSSWQLSVNVCFGTDQRQRPVVLKAVPTDSPELTALRLLFGPSLRKDKRNRAIPVLDFMETAHNFVIIVMPTWGICWSSPPCGNMTTRGELAMKLAETLQFLHANGVAHGDIHPFNIVINHFDSRNFLHRMKTTSGCHPISNTHISISGLPTCSAPELPLVDRPFRCGCLQPWENLSQRTF
ncbi:hypothetical protein B0H16DRAFT_2495 [Mycena metata]|uniref:Protein kinase domain-containing protein n=1 Tax=Mycena metata TaxID=1033252 RepID=A0AAD7KH75_9AGAR|nr:hypothetical protein B0H16DRAFT_2495 [Mycena metata]